MKLIVIPEKDQGRVGFMIEWEHRVTFAGEPPAKGVPIVVELDGVKKLSVATLRGWIAGKASQSEKPSRGRVLVLPEGCWRRAMLDDFVDGELHGWQTPDSSFTLQEYAAFLERWMPEVRAALDRVSRAETAKERRKALKAAARLATRAMTVGAWVPARLTVLSRKEQTRYERKRLARLEEAGLPVSDLIRAVAGFAVPHVQTEALIRLARRMAADETAGSADMMRALDQIRAHRRLSESVAYDQRFWEAVAPKVDLGATVKEGRFDISGAHETRVALNWETLSARRVGPLVPGRETLVVVDADTNEVTFIRGDRKLKFDAMRRGGSIERHGCTLTVQADPSVAAQTAFLDAERLDAIASLDPAQALQAVAELNLPPDHPVVVIAREAESDLDKRRVLADLLIELRHGLDPAVVREMSHSSTWRRR